MKINKKFIEREEKLYLMTLAEVKFMLLKEMLSKGRADAVVRIVNSSYGTVDEYEGLNSVIDSSGFMDSYSVYVREIEYVRLKEKGKHEYAYVVSCEECRNVDREEP